MIKRITVTGGTGNGVSMSAGNFTNSETGTITVSGGKGMRANRWNINK